MTKKKTKSYLEKEFAFSVLLKKTQKKLKIVYFIKTLKYGLSFFHLPTSLNQS